MKIRFMGTAACEGIPAMFCDCDVCRRAMQKGGKNIMTRSQALVDEELLIDFASDTYMHFLQAGKTMYRVRDVLITHTHEDHLVVSDFGNRHPGSSYGLKYPRLNMYVGEGSEQILERERVACKVYGGGGFEEDYNVVPVKKFETFAVGDYQVTAFPARHAMNENALLFLIEKDGRALFYGNDTGYFDESIDLWLAENNKKIDLLALDCTKGDLEQDYYTHMSMSEGARIADRFRKKGIIDQNTKLYYNHFSHNCKNCYDELVEKAKKYGFAVTYDGLEVEV